ncbi:UNVERIFIED_CONTAM: hypothetical protein GTU68_045715, partial [Idotea baltica]|nr:hypothetical protein [Idotea baltica]
MRAIVVVAARPNFMKVKPILDAFEGSEDEVLLVHTGQHYDAMMSDVFFADLGIRQPDVHLGIGSGSHAKMTADTMVGFDEVLADWSTDWVVVVGDVNATVASAVTAAKRGIKVAHVEAGLRSGDWAMPEEVNRVITDRVSDLLLAPSPDGVTNLIAEGVDPDAIHLVGNVMVDTLLVNAARAKERNVAAGLGVGDRYALATLHRPSNVDDPAVLEEMFGALLEIAEDIPTVLPAHPRSREALE